ncbi:hypothetical protein BKA67DRAFT_679038 [Truncatella angustata]|uniref:Uncharacterized protein n=1 Tax=Truncatella angustata TaxID=152316 RepID=A0A9P8ZX01_9PEZI|nr:uncharacterized protein BKA67DRAFT_679038 [Truncatella angustata]KAH6653462.1 hypothetical protein BKA67DRAFT_679038 [Truncatella angustata]
MIVHNQIVAIDASDGEQPPDLLLSLPPELRIMIYDYLVSVDMPLKLSWTPSSRRRSNEIRAKGLFGLIRTCRWQYMESHLVLGGTERKLRLSIDGALEGDGADLLPLMHPEKWQPNHEIAFVTASESQDCKEIVGHLTLVHLGRSSPFLLQVCGSVRISWRRWPVPFIVFVPVWYVHGGHDVMEHMDGCFLDYFGVSRLRNHLELRVASGLR